MFKTCLPWTLIIVVFNRGMEEKNYYSASYNPSNNSNVEFITGELSS